MQYDASTKYLVNEFPVDWLILTGIRPTGPVDLIDANLSTVTAEADKLIRIGGPDPSLTHIELQASRDVRLGCRLFRYNALIDDRHSLPTRSVVVLLRPEADSADLTGEYRRTWTNGAEYLVFRYEVIRIWRQPVESILHGGLGILPLAPVSNLGSMPLATVIHQMEERIDNEPPELSGLLWNSAAILMGLEHPAAMIKHLLRGVQHLKESSYYQSILAEGRVEGRAEGEILALKRSLIRRAERRLGTISAEDRAKIEALTEVDRVEALDDRVLDISTWTELWD